MSKSIISAASIFATTNRADELESTVESIQASHANIVNRVSQAELELQRLQQLLIDSETRSLDTTSQIYQSIKSLSEMCKDTDTKLLSFIQELECKTAKKIKRLVFAVFGLGIIDLILIITQFIMWLK